MTLKDKVTCHFYFRKSAITELDKKLVFLQKQVSSIETFANTENLVYVIKPKVAHVERNYIVIENSVLKNVVKFFIHLYDSME